ncbi:hypothetical protein AGMMS49944_19860 [Spirochaetia bacterium]|nr:hypothetical protein AGMMS49944_19860 [Spirochaetia bacterium]
MYRLRGQRTGARPWYHVPVKKDQSKLLEYAGMFDTDDVQLVQEMIDDRENFFKDRPGV